MNISTEDFSYRQIRNYFFEPQLSSGTEDDMITILNIPLLVKPGFNNDKKIVQEQRYQIKLFI